MRCKSGLQLELMQWNLKNNPLSKIAMKEWAAIGGNARVLGQRLRCNNGQQYAAMGGILMNYPLWLKMRCKSGMQWEDIYEVFLFIKIAMYESSALGFNGKSFDELSPGQHFDVRVGCNGLRSYLSKTPWPKLRSERRLHWAAMQGFYLCNDLQWEVFWRFSPGKSRDLGVRCKGLKWEAFWGFAPCQICDETVDYNWLQCDYFWRINPVQNCYVRWGNFKKEWMGDWFRWGKLGV